MTVTSDDYNVREYSQSLNNVRLHGAKIASSVPARCDHAAMYRH